MCLAVECHLEIGSQMPLPAGLHFCSPRACLLNFGIYANQSLKRKYYFSQELLIAMNPKIISVFENGYDKSTNWPDCFVSFSQQQSSDKLFNFASEIGLEIKII